MFCDCNAFVEAMGGSGRRWRCWAYILFQSRFPPWFLLSPTNLAFGSVHYTVLYSPSIRASLPLDWRSHQNPREKSLTFIGQDGHEKEDPLGAKKQDTVWCESCFFKTSPLVFWASLLLACLLLFLLCRVTCVANVMVTTWAFRLCFSFIIGRKKHSHNTLNPLYCSGLGVWGQRDEKSYIQSLLWNGDSSACWHYCSALTVSQPPWSAVHTRSSSTPPL